MSDFSFKNKKFPIKFIPTFLITISVSFMMTFLSIIFLQDTKEFLDLKQYAHKVIFGLKNLKFQITGTILKVTKKF